MGTKLYIAAFLSGISLATYGYFYVGGLKEDLAKMEVLNRLANSKAETYEEMVTFTNEQRKLNDARVTELYEQIEEAHDKVRSMQVLFSDHDFQKLVEAKPALITNRMIKATDKAFKDLENASN